MDSRRTLVDSAVGNIDAVLKPPKEVGQGGVLNWLAAGVVFQVSLRDVRHLLATVDQDSVPGLVFGRP